MDDSHIGRYVDIDFAEIERTMVEALTPSLVRFREMVDLTNQHLKDAHVRIKELTRFWTLEHPRGRRYEVASAARARRRMR